MTDNEIIKAIGDCVNNCGDCSECPSSDFCDKNDSKTILAATLDIINRLQARVDDLERNDLPRCKDALRRANEIGVELQAENESLSKKVDNLTQEVMYNDSITEMKVEEAKAEAYKVLENRLKKSAFTIDKSEGILFKKSVDNLLKKLVGEDNG